MCHSFLCCTYIVNLSYSISVLPFSESPSLRGSGLKSNTQALPAIRDDVSLFTREWIEIPEDKKQVDVAIVSLITREWIEIQN